MKLLDKFKKFIIDEEEDEIEKEYTKEIKIEQEVKIEKEKDEVEVTLTEREIYKSEPTFKFPAIYEEEDMMPKPEPRRPYVYDRNRLKPSKEEKHEEHKFVASPIISPVYGILDKNYKKDEISNKSDHPEYEDKRNYKKVDFDAIRQKAYGTLEEDIENTIMGDKGFIYGSTEEEEKEEVKEDPLIKEMGLTEEPKQDLSIEDAFENYSDYGVEYNTPAKHAAKHEEEEPMQKTEVLDNDLYELINSMYKEDETDEEEDK